MNTCLSNSTSSDSNNYRVAQSDERVELGHVHHTGDHVASHNYGSKVGGHVVASDQSRIDISTINTHNYNLAKGAVVHLSTSVFNDRLGILEWLSGLACLDFLPVHRANLAERFDGTGAWFLAHGKFKAWREGHARTLWCYGIPGSGKTILSSIVIEQIEESQRGPTHAVACLFIFFDHQHKEKQTSHKLTINILEQLVRQQQAVSETVQKMHKQHRFRATPPSLSELLMVIEKETQRFSKTWLIIDALDECSAHSTDNTREQFLQVIRRLPKTVSLLITSRHRRPAKSELDPVDEIEIAMAEDDLEHYVRGQTHMHSTYNEELSRMDVKIIIDHVSHNAKGMFLLARLHMNDIAAQQTRATLQSALENLPSDINETYEKAIQRVRPADLSLAKCVVSWITHSLRPLTALELRTALAVNENVTKLSEMTLHLHSETHVLSVCAGLVTIDAETSVIRLVHPTAEAYFRDYFTQPCAHSAIATTCLYFIMLKDLHKVVLDLNTPDSDLRIDELVSGSQSVSFLNYAAQNWGHHVRRADNPATNQLAIELLESNMSLEIIAKLMDSYHSGPTSALWIAAHFGLRDVVDHILRNKPSTITEIMQGETVMHVTAEMGYTGVMELLLATDGSSPDAINKSGRTPLTQASENGHYQIVQLLLASNAVDPDFSDQTMFYEGRTPLSWAAGNGHEMTVRYLLATNRVDANSTITKGLYTGRTPLFWAAGGGHGRVVRLLLDEGNADPTICDNDGYSPLTIAAQHGYEDIAKLLLQANRTVADKKEKVYGRRPVEWAIECQHDAVARFLLIYPTLDFRHEYGRTTLSYEAEHGYVKGVEILIEMGAGADVKDEDSWTPLMYAADGGHVEVVKALVRYGVDIDLTCADLRTSISYAAEAGHDEVVRVLLDHRASPDVPDCDQRTPLSYAAEHGHEVVVSLLLSSGRVNPDSRPNAGLYAGRTPLSFAAARGKLNIVQMLLNKGVAVDVAKTESGWGTQSPLQWAILNEHEAVAKLLLNLR